jgi:hypothetical protein
MRSRRTLRHLLVAITCAAGLCAGAPPAQAANGEFLVANCKSDRLTFSTDAFDQVATRGMKIRRACNPQGHGARALEVANVVRNGRVKDGAVAAVTMTAPPGTQFKTFIWGGSARRHDCGYQVQIYGVTPERKFIKVRNWAADYKCKLGTVGYVSSIAKAYPVPGATEIVLRVQCHPRHRAAGCSTMKSNYLRTYQAEAIIEDHAPPTVNIVPDTPIAQGAWVSGHQPVDYQASDTAGGVRSAEAFISGHEVGSDDRPCLLAVPAAEIFAAKTPCPNGPSRLDVDTRTGFEGTQSLSVSAADPAGNIVGSVPVIARIDNTPPGRVDVAVQDGDAWRNTNGFVIAWTNPPETDRAPIVAATYKLCRAGTDSCTTGQPSGDGLAGFPIAVPAPGEFTLALWRRDAAGNETDAAASVPVTLRYDPDPPQLGFDPPSAGDPTLVSVDVSDAVSGVATGSIEISQSGSGIWQPLPTQLDGNKLVARIDDVALPAGSYVLRARAADLANNEARTDLRVDGQPMALSLPLRAVTAIKTGFQTVRTVTQTRRRHGRAQRVKRRITVVRPAVKVASGGVTQVVGRLITAAGQGVAGQSVSVLSSSSVNAEQLVAQVQTDGDGRYSYAAPNSRSQTLRFAFAGSATMLPAQASVAMTVPALTSLNADRRRLRNGQTVTFSGALRTTPAPPAGKLVELQARLPGRWETFRTIRTDTAGHWTARYHFTRTHGLQRYRFRVRLPEEAGYPFAAGGSRTITVEVRG